jgi:hypothetical protein
MISPALTKEFIFDNVRNYIWYAVSHFSIVFYCRDWLRILQDCQWPTLSLIVSTKICALDFGNGQCG